MTDIFSAVVTAADLTKQLIGYINEVREADESIEQFRSQLQLTNVTLIQIQSVSNVIPDYERKYIVNKWKYDTD